MADDRVRGNPPGEVAATVAARVGELRRERGLSVRELSDRLTAAGRRMSADALMKLETNARRVDVDDLATLATVLSCTPADLLRSHSLDPAAHGRLERHIPALRRALVDAFQTGFTREQLQDYVEQVAAEFLAVVYASAHAADSLKIIATSPVSVDVGQRQITGLAVPYGSDISTSAGVLGVVSGSIGWPDDSSRIKLFDRLRANGGESVGYAAELFERPDGLWATFQLGSSQRCTDALAVASERIRDTLAVELFDHAVEGGKLNAATLAVAALTSGGTGDVHG